MTLKYWHARLVSVVRIDARGYKWVGIEQENNFDKKY